MTVRICFLLVVTRVMPKNELTDPPWDNSNLLIWSALETDHWSTAVSHAGVLSLLSSAKHVLCDASGGHGSVYVLALGVVPNLESDLLEDGRSRAGLRGQTPTHHGGRGFGRHIGSLGSKAHWTDVLGVGGGRSKPQNSNIIVLEQKLSSNSTPPNTWCKQ